MKRFALWSLAVVAVGLVCAAIGFRFWFHAFLRSEQCRQWLDGAASKALHAEGKFMLLQPQSAESIYTDGFVARNGEGFRLLQADQIRADVRFGFWARSCSVERLDVTRARIFFDSVGGSAKAGRADSSPGKDASSSGDGAVGGPKTRFVLRQLNVADLQLAWNGGELKGAQLRVKPSGDTMAEWLLTGRGGSVKLQGGPEWRVDSFEARHRGRTLFLTDARLRMNEGGEARVEGEFGGENPAQCRITFSGVPVASLLPPDWRARLTGKLSGRIHLKGGEHRGGQAGGSEMQIADGNAVLAEGELSALPWLDQVAELTHTDGFRRMRIHKGAAEFKRTGRTGADGTLEVSQFVMESNGLLRVEGAFKLVGGEIDGVLQVGVAPSVLQGIPGAREKVFVSSRDGYLWTPVRVSGAAVHPSEDLTARLAAAAVNQSVDAVKEGVRENAQGLIDKVAPLLPVQLPTLPGLGR